MSKKKSVFEKIVDILLDILIFLFGVLLLVFIYNNIQTKIFGNDYASIFGYSTFEVQTGSMSKTIDAGDWIIVKYSNDINLDDIVTYKKDDAFITHRVVEEYKGVFVTKGDANNAKDDPITQDQIVGKVVKILPNFGLIRKTILNPAVLIALIITLYLIGYIIRNMKKNKNSSDDNIKLKIDGFLNRLLDKFFKKDKKESDVKKPTKKVIEVIEEREIKKEEPYLLDDELDDDKDEIENDNEIIEDNSDDDIEIEPLPEVDMEQTRFFRMVSVNKDEVDGVYSRNKKVENKVEEKEYVELSDEDIENESEKEKDNCITHLQSSTKKFKNIVDKIMYVKRDEIDNIIDIFNNHDKLKTNESTIRSLFLDTYMNARYYNNYGDEDISNSSKKSLSKINDAIKYEAAKMLKKYKGSDNRYEEKVEKYTKYYILANNIEQLNIIFDDTKSKRENYKNKLLSAFKSDLTSAYELMDMVNSIIITQKVHKKIITESLEKLNSNTFKLNIDSILSKKHLYGVKLDYNITFSKVYSDYIIDKTYSEGIIAEDKTMIMITMILSNMIKDMLNSEFDNKYFIYLPGEIYEKPNKLNKILEMFNDDFAKNHIIILNLYEEVIDSKRVIKRFRKDGYKFAVTFKDDDVIKSKDASALSLADYVFVTKKQEKDMELLDNVSSEIKENIIYEDVYSKVIE